MSDPRTTADPARASEETPRCVAVPVVDLCRAPDGQRDRQLLFGQGVTVLDQNNGWSYVRAARDGYFGFVQTEALQAPQTATHYVSAPCTHAYEAANFKTRDTLALSHLSLISALSETEGYIETAQGFIPQKHLTPVDQMAADPASIAAHYLGTDYLWGGNSRWGLDCSGLVQAALLACGAPCPGDSDQQMALGMPANGPYQRNDLLFWKGHVALVTDPDTIIHANAHAMATCLEPISSAIERIAKSGDGPVTAHRRLVTFSGLNSSLPEA